MKYKKVILDTDLWISFLLKKEYADIDLLIFTEKIKLIFSEQLLEEFLISTQQPLLKKYFNKLDLEEILYLFDIYGQLLKVKRVNFWNYKNNFLIELSKQSKADYLVTTNMDLLLLKYINNKTKIVTWEYFIQEVEFLYYKNL